MHEVLAVILRYEGLGLPEHDLDGKDDVGMCCVGGDDGGGDDDGDKVEMMWW